MVQSLKSRNSQIFPPDSFNVDSGQILRYLDDFHFNLFPLFYEIQKFNKFIFWLMERAETCDCCSNQNGKLFRAEDVALMTHSLFEWKLRTKTTALSDNFALIIKVNMLDLLPIPSLFRI